MKVHRFTPDHEELAGDGYLFDEWLPRIGPSAAVIYRHALHHDEVTPGAVGLNAYRFEQAVQRLAHFHLATPNGDTLIISDGVPVRYRRGVTHAG